MVETTVSSPSALESSTKNDCDPGGKSLKKLKKKLAAIEDLKRRRDAGEKLEDNQVKLHTYNFQFVKSRLIRSRKFLNN